MQKKNTKYKIEALMSPNYIEAYINFSKPKFSEDPVFPGQTSCKLPDLTTTEGGGTTEAAKLQYLAGYCSYTEAELEEKNKKLSASAAKEYKLSLIVRSAPHTRTVVTPTRLHYCAKRRLGRPSWPRAGERC